LLFTRGRAAAAAVGITNPTSSAPLSRAPTSCGASICALKQQHAKSTPYGDLLILLENTHVASCCVLFAFVSGHFRAFPKSSGNSTRHTRDMNTSFRKA
jgi:hypothetical protein